MPFKMIYAASVSLMIGSVLFSACAGKHKNDPNHLIVGVMSGPEYKMAEELKDESTVIIPNDPTNGGRSLLLLQKAGLLKLREGVGLFPTVNDIVVAREDNKSEPKVATFVKAYESPEVDAVAQKEFKGGAAA